MCLDSSLQYVTRTALCSFQVTLLDCVEGLCSVGTAAVFCLFHCRIVLTPSCFLQQWSQLFPMMEGKSFHY